MSFSMRRSSGLGRNSRVGSIDPTRLVRMDKLSAIGGSGDFNVVFIGAGNIMFGSDEGPWNHSFRFEHKLGPRLKVTALIDPAVDRAHTVLRGKCESFVKSAYENTQVFKNFNEYVAAQANSPRPPNAFLIGSPPMFRGTTKPGCDIEMQIMKHFPGVPMFVEKPTTTGPVDEIAEAYKVAKEISNTRTIVSVGYMLRYLKAVQMMKQILIDEDLQVMSTVARYACAYEAIAKPDWWDKSKRSEMFVFKLSYPFDAAFYSAGPVVEQGTHFCDLSRYFGGDVDLETVSAHSLEWFEKAGKLSKMQIDESKIAEENRIPRVTSATWKYKNGAVGSFTHVVGLQGTNYSCELEVFADGYSLKLVNPYVNPVLYVRRPGNDNEETHTFPDDDPFFSEVSNWIDVVEDIEEDPEASQILSSYEDACKTYEFTWAIRLASEQSKKKTSA